MSSPASRPEKKSSPGRVVLVNNFNPFLCDGVSRSGYDLLRLLIREEWRVGVAYAIVDNHPYRRRVFEYFGQSALSRSAIYSGHRCSVDFDGILIEAELLDAEASTRQVVGVLTRLLREMDAERAITVDDDLPALIATAIAGMSGPHLFHSLTCAEALARSPLACRLLQSRPLVSCSEFLAARVRERLGLNSEVCYPVMRIGEFAPVSDPRQLPQAVGYYSGGPHKGDEIVIGLARLLPTVRFVVAGRLFRSSAEGLPNVDALGDVSEMAAFYRRVGLLVVPSLCEEAFSRVTIEALVNGIPVIANRVGGIPESGGNAAVLVDVNPGSRGIDGVVAEYARLITTIFEQRSIWCDLSRKALEWGNDFKRRQLLMNRSCLSAVFNAETNR